MFREGGQLAAPQLAKAASAMTEGPLGVGVGSFKHDPLRGSLSLKEHANPAAGGAVHASASGNPFGEVREAGGGWRGTARARFLCVTFFRLCLLPQGCSRYCWRGCGGGCSSPPRAPVSLRLPQPFPAATHPPGLLLQRGQE